ncbi:MAG: MFS transporter [Dehalococcoidia bacterium]
MAFLCLSVLILAIDDGVLNLALPSISNEFRASTSQLQWAINAYLLAFAALLLTMGALGDRFGRKRMFQAGLVIFGISSLGAALSTSMGTLIACRALMGVGGAVTMPQTLSIIRATFADPKERAQAIAIWAGVFALGYGIGPVVGGSLLEYFEWNSVFLLNIPIVIITFAGGKFFIRESRDESAPGLDLPGLGLSIAGLFLLVYGIIKAGEQSWTEGSVIVILSVGAIISAIFAWWETRSDHPMLPMKFFKNMSFTGANIAMTLAAFGTGALLFFLSQYLQSVQGYSPLEAALRLMPVGVFAFVSAIVAAPIARAIGVKAPVSLGIFICGGGLFYLSFADTDASYLMILGGMSLVGVGFGLAWSPAADSVMGSLPASQAGIGSAMDATTQQVGGALGVAGLGAIMNGIYLDKIGNLSVLVPLPEEARETIRGSVQGAHIVAGQSPEGISQMIITGSNDAFTSGMTEAMFIGATVMAVASLVALFILPSRIRPAQEQKKEDTIV